MDEINKNELEVNEALRSYKNQATDEKKTTDEKRYTYADYISWDDELRWELIDGVPYLMAAPRRCHQRILINLTLPIANYLKGKTCKVYIAPFDVRLDKDKTDSNVVQPDLVIVCDKSILTENGCDGVPDMVVEILSPSTKQMDMLIKLKLYLRVGVREYWIVDPEYKNIRKHILDEYGRYDIIEYDSSSKIPVDALGGFEIDLNEVFEE